MRHAFVFDQNRCTGCGACVLACAIENELPPLTNWRGIHTQNPDRLPDIPLVHLSLACNHCERPACLEACPAAAYTKDGPTGAVLIDDSKCIGCRYCTWACPYDAPKFSHETGTVSKCTFCVDRLRGGLEPACAAGCPTDALTVSELAEEEITNGVEGFPKSTLGPAIRIVPLRPGHEAPEMSAETAPAVDLRAFQPRIADGGSAGSSAAGSGAAATAFASSGASAAGARKIRFRSEWSLAVFTFLMAALVGAMIAHRFARLAVPWWLFVAVGGPAMLLSAAHLGRKERAWRAVLNLRTSWLSREVASVPAFLALSVAHLALRPENTILCAVAVLAGLIALYSMDRVYDVTVSAPGARPHSAGVLITGVFLAAVMGGIAWAAAALGLVKLALYVRRKLGARAAGEPWRPELSALRVGVGLVLPAILWWAGGDPVRGWTLVLVLLGEFIDRGEFYEELDVPSPARETAAALRRAVQERRSRAARD